MTAFCVKHHATQVMICGYGSRVQAASKKALSCQTAHLTLSGCRRIAAIGSKRSIHHERPTRLCCSAVWDFGGMRRRLRLGQIAVYRAGAKRRRDRKHRRHYEPRPSRSTRSPRSSRAGRSHRAARAARPGKQDRASKCSGFRHGQFGKIQGASVSNFRQDSSCFHRCL
jgi:hypothetical protein